MRGILSNDEWIQLTDMLNQMLTDKIHDAQLDLMRQEHFSKTPEPALREKLDRLARAQKALRSLNFVFKCYDVDWDVVMQTIVDLMEGKVDVVKGGLDRQPVRDQPDGQADQGVAGIDDPDAR
jgi:hypothetical protein